MPTPCLSSCRCLSSIMVLGSGIWRVGSCQCWEMICGSAAVWNTGLKAERGLSVVGGRSKEQQIPG